MSCNSDSGQVLEAAGTRERALATFRNYLHNHGLRLTSQREAIVSVALAQGGHFDAEELHDALRAAGGEVSLATVYRALAHMQDAGLVREVMREDGRAHYEAARGAEHHDHMVCIECGRVIEFFSEEIERLQEAVCRAHGFRPVDHRMSIRGLCPRCARKIQQQAPRAGD